MKKQTGIALAVTLILLTGIGVRQGFVLDAQASDNKAEHAEDGHAHEDGESGQEKSKDDHGDEDGHGAEGDDHGHGDESGHGGEEDKHGNEEHAEGEIELSEEQIRAAGIQLSKVGPAEIGSSVSLPGELRFDEDRTAHVVPRVAGVVESVSVNLGDQVKKGQLLAVIASQQLSEQRSELAAAEQRLRLARILFERERTLWQERISAEQDYLQAQQSLRVAEIDLRNAQEKTRALGGGSDSGVGNRYELRAPFDAVVVEKHIVLGERADETTSVFTLTDLSRVWATFSVPARDLMRVTVGREVKVAHVGSLLGEQTRAATARVTLANPDGAWRPGLFVTVRVSADGRSVPVTVPVEAVQTVENAPTVFVRTPHGFQAHSVSLGQRDENRVEIRDGLQAGQQIATAGSFILKSELGKGSAEHVH
ncbi:MAG: efflux RND transporter periplasmic adaptor subunit [Gammaproteobacteria bacterium HGW-Gammaproteobacteria-9]|nr:MAG: efflux RND transporter periplasmic adaptor subunit [Gammaproteobacteria bacterium HGW-Gammaproteobacteria-9]